MLAPKQARSGLQELFASFGRKAPTSAPLYSLPRRHAHSFINLDDDVNSLIEPFF